MSFDIPIKIDPNTVLPAIKRVEDGLSAAEKKALALSRNAQAAFNGLGGLMAGIAAATEQEARMLERATGKSKDYGFQLTALRKLHNEGRISAEQYITTLEKLGHKIETMPDLHAHRQTAFNMISMGSDEKGNLLKPQSARFDPSSLAGPAAAAAAGAAAFMALDDQYTKLSNSALKFVDSGHNMTMVLAEQRTLAQELQSTSSNTIGTYDAVRDATDGLNLTQREQLQLTKSVSQIARLGSKDAEGLASSWYEVKVAMETGQDPGRQMITLFKQYPDLADQLQHSLNMSSKEIVDAARKGHLSFDEMTRGMIHDTDELQEKSAKFVESWSTKWGRFKEDLSAPVDVQGAFDALNNVDMAINRVTQDIAKQAAHWKELEEARNRGLTGLYTATRLDTPEQRASQMGYDREKEVTEAQKQLAALQVARNKGLIPEQYYEEDAQHLRDVIAGIKQHTAALSEEEKMLDRIHGPQDEQSKGIALAGLLYGKAAITLAEYNDEIARLMALTPTKSVTGGAAASITTPDYGISGNQLDATVPAPAMYDRDAYKKGLDDLRAAAFDFNDNVAADAEEKSRQLKEAWASAAGSIAGDMIAAFQKGDESTSEIIDHMLQKLALMTLQMGAMQMGGGTGKFLAAAIGGIGGFATGGSFVVPGGPGPALPRAWGGNDWTVGGSGGTDSKHVSFMATPGERVLVQTQEQQRQGNQQRLSGPTKVVVQTVYDRREIVDNMDSREGERVVARLGRRMNRRR